MPIKIHNNTMIPITERASNDPYIIIRTKLNLFLYLTLDMIARAQAEI